MFAKFANKVGTSHKITDDKYFSIIVIAITKEPDDEAIARNQVLKDERDVLKEKLDKAEVELNQKLDKGREEKEFKEFRGADAAENKKKFLQNYTKEEVAKRDTARTAHKNLAEPEEE